ncbi:Serine/threonine-protein kinase Sgk3, partial [Linderina macrospora]
MAYAAYITSVETREQTGGGLRMGRKKYLVYRILVTGRSGQWWVERRYNEFTDLHQTLKRAFPQHAVHWAELPTRRLIGGRSAASDASGQKREKLNMFLKSLTGDAEVCCSETVQRFLRDAQLDAESIPLQERVDGARESLKLHGQLGFDGQSPAELGSPSRPPLPQGWGADLSMTSEQQQQQYGIEKMKSMPMLSQTQQIQQMQ